MAPYAEFLVDFTRRHRDHVHCNTAGNGLAAVIVETRPAYFLPRVIRNVMYFLGPEWNLYVVTAQSTVDFIHRELRGWRPAVVPVPDELLSRNGGLRREQYNRLLCSPEFWRWFGEEKLLTFQVDSLLTGAGIGGFLDYDYIGAPCFPRRAGPSSTAGWRCAPGG